MKIIFESLGVDATNVFFTPVHKCLGSRARSTVARF